MPLRKEGGKCRFTKTIDRKSSGGKTRGKEGSNDALPPPGKLAAAYCKHSKKKEKQRRRSTSQTPIRRVLLLISTPIGGNQLPERPTLVVGICTDATESGRRKYQQYRWSRGESHRKNKQNIIKKSSKEQTGKRETIKPPPLRKVSACKPARMRYTSLETNPGRRVVNLLWEARGGGMCMWFRMRSDIIFLLDDHNDTNRTENVRLWDIKFTNRKIEGCGGGYGWGGGWCTSLYRTMGPGQVRAKEPGSHLQITKGTGCDGRG